MIPLSSTKRGPNPGARRRNHQIRTKRAQLIANPPIFVSSIQVGAPSLNPFKLYSQHIDVESIKILKLVFCEVDIPPNLQGLRFLHTLELPKVDIMAKAIEMLFCHCLLLETLELWQCYKLQHLNVFGRNLKRFKVLKLRHCTDIMQIYVESPTLHSIYYIGTVVSFEFAEVL
jgi:hypothetical protein